MNRQTQRAKANRRNTKINLNNPPKRMKTKDPGEDNVIVMAGGTRKVEPPPFDESNPPLFLQLRSGAWIGVSFRDIYSFKAPETSWAKVELWITPGSYYRGMEACFKDDQPTTKGASSLTTEISRVASRGG